jgi:hypothetical protein
MEVRGERRGGIIVVLPMERGKIDISHLISFCSTVERMGRMVRGGLRSDDGYGALRSSSMSWLGYGARGRVGPRRHPLHTPLLSLSSPQILKTLAAMVSPIAIRVIAGAKQEVNK